MNVVCLVGRLTADVELRQTPNGINVTSFCVAVQSSSKNADGTYKTDFINCVAWRNTAEFISRYFRKGQNIGLNGSIQTRQYQDKDTGKNRIAFEVLVNNTYFVESKGSSTQGSSNNFSNGNNQMMANPIGMNSFSTGELDDFSNVSSDDGDLPF